MDVQKLREKLHEFLDDRTDDEIRALALVLDVQPDYGGLSRAQHEELMRRHQLLLEGKLETIPHEEAMAMLRSKLRRNAA